MNSPRAKHHEPPTGQESALRMHLRFDGPHQPPRPIAAVRERDERDPPRA